MRVYVTEKGFFLKHKSTSFQYVNVIFRNANKTWECVSINESVQIERCLIVAPRIFIKLNHSKNGVHLVPGALSLSSLFCLFVGFTWNQNRFYKYCLKRWENEEKSLCKTNKTLADKKNPSKARFFLHCSIMPGIALTRWECDERKKWKK